MKKNMVTTDCISKIKLSSSTACGSAAKEVSLKLARVTTAAHVTHLRPNYAQPYLQPGKCDTLVCSPVRLIVWVLSRRLLPIARVAQDIDTLAGDRGGVGPSETEMKLI